MSSAPDPFAHHPELRDKIGDPLQSRFRSVNLVELAKVLAARGLPTGWWHTDEEREVSRAEFMANWPGGDLWVFAYGSLMWDPSFRFVEVRRAHVADHARRFILKDVNGARGTREAPGLMAALDVGGGCDGLAFRIAEAEVEAETAILWQRERIGPGYIATFVEAELSDRRVTALTFVADHATEGIAADLTREEQVRFFATGSGFLGTSLEYLTNIAAHFEALGIHDEEVVGLLRETKDYIGAHTEPA